MRDTLVYVVFGLVAYLIFVLATFPADRAYAWSKSALGLPVASGIDGTVWSGRARHVVWDGTSLDGLDWGFRPAQLLRGRLGYGVVLETGAGRVQGVVARGLGQTLSLSDVQGELDAKEVGKWLGLKLAELGGQISVDVSEIRLGPDGIRRAEGTVDWTNAMLRTPSEVSLGAFRVSFETEGEGVVGRVSDHGEGPVEAQGELSLIGGRSYRFSGQLGGRGAGSVNIQRGLALLGTPRAGGKFEVAFSGELGWLDALFPPVEATAATGD